MIAKLIIVFSDSEETCAHISSVQRRSMTENGELYGRQYRHHLDCIREKRFVTISLYLYRRVCVSVCVSFQAYTRRRLWSDRNQIWHTHADSPRNGSGQNKNLPCVT